MEIVAIMHNSGIWVALVGGQHGSRRVEEGKSTGKKMRRNWVSMHKHEKYSNTGDFGALETIPAEAPEFAMAQGGGGVQMWR